MLEQKMSRVIDPVGGADVVDPKAAEAALIKDAVDCIMAAKKVKKQLHKQLSI